MRPRHLHPRAMVRIVSLIVVLQAFCLPGCGGRHEQTATRAAGAPTRIISLVPAATEMLFRMGAGPRVIAVSSYDRYPPGVEKLPRVGALLDPDMERIIAMRPDLVIVFEGQVELREKLTQAGIPLFLYPRPSVADIIAAMRSLGRRVGRRVEADRDADDIAARLDAVRARVAGLPAPRTLLVIGREPGTLRNVYASGGVGFLNDLLTIAGGTNVFADVKRENLQVTTEAMLAARPDVIVEVVAEQPWTQADIAREEQVWDALPSLPAVRQHRVYLLMGDEFVTPGPRVVLAAPKIAEVLHRVPG